MKVTSVITRLFATLALASLLLTSSCCFAGLFDDDDANLPGGGGHDEGTGGNV